MNKINNSCNTYVFIHDNLSHSKEKIQWQYNYSYSGSIDGRNRFLPSLRYREVETPALVELKYIREVLMHCILVQTKEHNVHNDIQEIRFIIKHLCKL